MGIANNLKGAKRLLLNFISYLCLRSYLVFHGFADMLQDFISYFRIISQEGASGIISTAKLHGSRLVTSGWGIGVG